MTNLGKCVECFTIISKGHICDACQERLSNPPPWNTEEDIPPKSEWRKLTMEIGRQLDKSIKKEKN